MACKRDADSDVSYSDDDYTDNVNDNNVGSPKTNPSIEFEILSTMQAVREMDNFIAEIYAIMKVKTFSTFYTFDLKNNKTKLLDGLDADNNYTHFA